MEKNGYITFGSLNNSLKVTPEVLALWTDLLRAEPRSKLSLTESITDSKYNEYISTYFKNQAIAANRIVIRKRVPIPAFLREIDQIDVALDTFPYTGGITTYQALAMGVPTITLEGMSEYERNCAAILREATLDQCVAQTKEKYLEKVLTLPYQATVLKKIRKELPGALRKKAPSCTRELGTTLLAIIEKHPPATLYSG